MKKIIFFIIAISFQFINFSMEERELPSYQAYREEVKNRPNQKLLEALLYKKPTVEEVTTLLDQGADPNVALPLTGDTALILAIKQYNIPVIQLLLSKGADVNKSNKNKDTALLVAVDAASQINIAFNIDPNLKLKIIKIIETLLNNQADPNVQNINGDSALIKSIGSRDIDLVNLLLQNKANIKMVNKRGNTPLHVAAFLDNIGITELLLRNGADPNVRNYEGDTPLIMAADFGSTVPVIQKLLAWGADPDLQNNVGQSARSILPPELMDR